MTIDPSTAPRSTELTTQSLSPFGEIELVLDKEDSAGNDAGIVAKEEATEGAE